MHETPLVGIDRLGQDADHASALGLCHTMRIAFCKEPRRAFMHSRIGGEFVYLIFIRLEIEGGYFYSDHVFEMPPVACHTRQFMSVREC